MKKKIMLAILVGILSLSGVVSAASMWGTYKGNDIIRITIDGNPVKVSDVPAINYQSRTMIPIYLLKEAGINYAWDQETRTVNIQSDATESSVGSFDPTARTKEIIALGGGGVTLMNESGEMTAIVYYAARNGLDGDWNDLFSILTKLIDFNAVYSRIIYVDGQENMIEIKTQDLRDYLNGKITDEQLQSLWVTSFANGINQNTVPNNSSTSDVAVSSVPELYSNDGKVFLGELTSNKYDSDSVYNEYGDYGSKYSDTSIWNEYGDYGSEYSDESAFNKYASKPPIIVQDGEIIGYLTVNDTISDSISPYELLSWIENNGF